MTTKRISLKFTILIASILTAFGGGIAVSAEENDSGSPIAIYRSYIEAVEKEDLEAAKECWTVDDDNLSILDITIGVWISSRRLFKAVSHRFGKEALEKFEFYHDGVTDQALRITKKRLDESKVVINGNHAKLQIKWHEDDGYPNSAFEFSADDPVLFLRVNGKWKLDTKEMVGEATYATGSISFGMRLCVTAYNDATRALENGQFTSVKELEQFIGNRLTALSKEHQKQQQDKNAQPQE